MCVNKQDKSRFKTLEHWAPLFKPWVFSNFF